MSSSHKTYQARILVADDEENTRNSIVRALQLSGYQSEGASNGREVLEKLGRYTFHILLLDLNMPEVDGISVMQFIREHDIKISVIVLTAYATLNSAIAAIKAGAVDYLLKPQRIADIEKSIRHALAQNSTQINRSRLIEVMQQTLLELQQEDETAGEKLQNTESLDDRQAVLIFNPELHQATVRSMGKTRIRHSTSDQVQILSYLTDYPGKILSSMEIALKALGCRCENKKEADSIIRPHILRLRQKIEVDPGSPTFIRTIRGAGYAFFHISL